MGMASREPTSLNLISWGWTVPPGEDLFVFHAGELCPGWPLNPRSVHRTDSWQLDYSFSPHDLKIGRDRWRPRELHVAYLIPRYMEWRERNVPEYRQGPHKCTITFAVSQRMDFDKKYWHDAPRGYVRFRDPDRVLANSMTHVAATARALGDSGYRLVHALVWDLLQSLTRLQPIESGVYVVKAGDLRQPLDPLVTKATAYLQQHVADKIEIRDVARHVGISESTLTHRFKAAGGSSPMKTLQNLRILRAKALLAQGWKLDAIAEATGFYGGFHLSRVFKQVVGVSPAKYLVGRP